jgi:chromosome segregation ATPase
MAQTDLERFTRLVLDEFKSVHTKLDKHDERLDSMDQRLGNIERELRSIRTDLDVLHEKVENVLGYRKEIDHALERIAAIEKRLGIDTKIPA